jgi:hypothetical protein
VKASSRTLVLLGCVGVLFAPAPAAAQRIQGGVEGGLAVTNLANLTNAIDFGGPVDVQWRTGLVAGPFVRFPVNDTVAMQVEALVGTKGASPTDGTNEIKIQLLYLDVPLLIHVRPAPARPFYFLLGPSVNFNLKARTVDVLPSEVEEDVKDQIKTAEFGVVFGAGLTFRRFFTEGRYSVGLTDIGDAPQLTDTIRNHGFMILAGVTF